MNLEKIAKNAFSKSKKVKNCSNQSDKAKTGSIRQTKSNLVLFFENNTISSLVQRIGEEKASVIQMEIDSLRKLCEESELTSFNGVKFSNNSVVLNRENLSVFEELVAKSLSEQETAVNLISKLKKTFESASDNKTAVIRASVEGGASNHYSDLAEGNYSTVVLRVFGENSSVDGLFLKELVSALEEESSVTFLGEKSRIGRNSEMVAEFLFSCGLKDIKVFFSEERAKFSLDREEEDKYKLSTRAGGFENFSKYFNVVTASDCYEEAKKHFNGKTGASPSEILLTVRQGVLFNGTVTEFLSYLLKKALDRSVKEKKEEDVIKKAKSLITGTKYENKLRKYLE